MIDFLVMHASAWKSYAEPYKRAQEDGPLTDHTAVVHEPTHQAAAQESTLAQTRPPDGLCAIISRPHPTP